ncbi:MAG TPA: DUF3592 domain-containing protein [Gemmatimonadaceae bacterium]
MRIVHDSRDALILNERAIALRAIGAVLGIAGLVMMVASVLANGLSVAALLIVGAVMAALGALMGLLPATHTFAFSRSERRLIVVRQRLGRVTREEYPLRDVASAFVDSSKSSDGDTWRVVVQLTDGQIIPVTSYYTSGYDGKKLAADRITEFVNEANNRDSEAPATHTPAPYTPTLTSPRQTRAALAFLALFGLVFGGIGGTIMWREQQRLATWLPVEATVLNKSVERHSDSDGTTYSPLVVYQYSVNDRQYTSSSVLPTKESRSGGWASKIVDEYEPNRTYTAWYNPADPAQAFLRRSRSIVAAIFTAVGALLVVVALLVHRRTSPGVSTAGN